MLAPRDVLEHDLASPGAREPGRPLAVALGEIAATQP
jgi:hypothetical protein